MAAYVLTESDVQVLRGLVQRVRQSTLNVPNRTAPPPDDSPAPDVYIAWVPFGGIPALTQALGTGTGTGSLGGSGDRPGHADCWVHRITGEGNELLPISKKQRVYNVSGQAVTADTWAVVGRDKFGNWIVLHGESQSSDGVMVRDVHGVTVDHFGSASVLQLDRDTGIGISSIDTWLGAQRATFVLIPATATQTGALTTDTQMISGTKVLINNLVACGDIQMAAGSGSVSEAGVPDYGFDLGWKEVGVAPFDLGAKWSLSKRVLGTTYPLLSVWTMYQNYVDPGIAGSLRMDLGPDDDGKSIGMAVGFPILGLDKPCFFLNEDGGGNWLGAYYEADGWVVKGGIIITMGSSVTSGLSGTLGG